MIHARARRMDSENPQKQLMGIKNQIMQDFMVSKKLVSK